MVTPVNDTVYAHVRERTNEYRLTEQEALAIDTARGQLQTHSRIGGAVGATLAFLAGRKRLATPFQVAVLTGGCLVLGAQVGLMSGTMAGYRTIQSLPRHERMTGIFKDVQKEMMEAKRFRRAFSRPVMMEATQVIPPKTVNTNQLEYLATPSPLETETSPYLEPFFNHTSAWDRIRSHHIRNHAWTKARYAEPTTVC